MIAFWNKKELFIGYSLQKFNEVRQILSANKIGYKYKLVNNDNAYIFSSRRARTGTFGENTSYSTTYYIYVHNKDYQTAYAMLKK